MLFFFPLFRHTSHHILTSLAVNRSHVYNLSQLFRIVSAYSKMNRGSTQLMVGAGASAEERQTQANHVVAPPHSLLLLAAWWSGAADGAASETFWPLSAAGWLAVQTHYLPTALRAPSRLGAATWRRAPPLDMTRGDCGVTLLAVQTPSCCTTRRIGGRLLAQ